MNHPNDTLHLVLKREWYDMIASGEKTEEYRAITAYWISRLLNHDTLLMHKSWHMVFPSVHDMALLGNLLDSYLSKGYKKVKFYLGYSSDHTMTFELLSMRVGYGNSD